MRKSFRSLLLALGLFITVNITPIATDDTSLLETLKAQTTESFYMLKKFNLGLSESVNIVDYPAICPISTGDIYRISSEFGQRIHPIYNDSSYHRGIDYAAPTGTDVVATGNGIIRGIKKEGGYGKQIVIDHGNDYLTRYGHLSKISVMLGDTVSIGDTIGAVGSTGLSTGPHLHYEIIHQQKVIDPMSIYPDTLRKDTYLDFQAKLGEHLLSCSDNV